MDYKKQYKECKARYLAEKNNRSMTAEINKVQELAHQQAYNLLCHIESYKNKHNIVTAESLTAGLIFSTLVDIPFGGKHKYGCFGVYDTDAKRVFLGVEVEDVYTHKCAKEMVTGALKNSNASIAISVTGNAKADAKAGKSSKSNRLGEVFIGVAGYSSNNKIKVATNVYNFCHNIETCHDYNDPQKTYQISMYIRYATVAQALKDCRIFLEQNKDLVIPSFISDNRIQKDSHKHEMHDDRKIRMTRPYYYKEGEKFIQIDNTHNKTLIHIPNDLEVECVDIVCDDVVSGKQFN